LLFLLFAHLDVLSQGSIGINETGANPDPKAILDLVSDDQGFLIPRMTASERDGISSPAKGLLVYQNDDAKGFYYYDGSAWRPWLKPRAGAVTMELATSSIDKGQGFTVTHIQEGRDQVIYTEPYSIIPDVTLSAEGLPGAAPRVPFDYCFSSYTNCTDVHARFIRLKTASGVSPDATVFMETGVSGCNPASNNYTFYNLSHPAYTTSPNFPITLTAGQTFYIYSSRSLTASSSNVNAFSLWFDWDQNGEFDAVNSFGNSELILSETGGITTSAGANIGALNYPVSIPSSANYCNGVITGRLVVRDQATAPPGLPPCLDATRGETEDFELQVSGGQNCTYPAKSVNCNILNPNLSGFQVNCVDRDGLPINGKYNFKVIQ
jgi:hypothetical protein